MATHTVDDPLVRKQYYVAQSQVAKLEELKKTYGFESSAEALRRAIDAYDPSEDAQRLVALDGALERMGEAIEVTRRELSEARRRLDEATDPDVRERERETIREELRAHYRHNPGELAGLSRLFV